MALRWADFITPSTLQLAPLLELLLEPIQGTAQRGPLQLGLQEVLVNAVRHGNGNDPGKCLRVRRILTPRWLVFQVQDEGGRPAPTAPAAQTCPSAATPPQWQGLFLIHQCFEDVRWSRRGNRVQVAARRAA